MRTEEVKVGQLVAIRGDLRRNRKGECLYTDDQLVGGKYLRHKNQDKIWIGPVSAVDGDMALVGGGWRGMENLELEKNISWDLRYSLMTAALDCNETRHPQEVMAELGISYQRSLPQSIADQWWFGGCINLPTPLPRFLTPLPEGLKW